MTEAVDRVSSQQEDWPESLYRYRPAMTDEDMTRLRSVLVGHALYFSGASTLNDPFDCAPNFEVSESRHQLEAYFRHLGRQYAPHMTANQLKAYVDSRLSDRAALEQELTQSFLNVISAVSVCCFSAKWDGPLMWSHYAGGHSGVCLEFAARTDGSFLTLPVVYSSQRPIMSPTYFSRGKNNSGEYAEVIDRVLLTKSKAWEYEDEWRVIMQRTPPAPQPFAPRLLTRVILGHRMLPSRRAQVLELVKEGGLSCPVVVAQLHPREFGLQLQEL